MRRYRTALIIAAAAVVIAAALYAVIMLLPPEEQLPEESPMPSDSLTLLTLERSDIKNIEVSTANGEVFTVYGEAGAMRIEPAAEGFSYSEDKINAFFYAIMNLTASKLIYEAPTAQELSDTGFDSPAAVCTVNFTDGRTTSLTIGKENVTASDRYIQLCDDKAVPCGEHAVYLLPLGKCETLMKPEPAYRDLQFIPVYDGSTDPMYMIQNVLLQSEESLFEIQVYSEDELAGLPSGASPYHILQPFDADGLASAIDEKLLSLISMIAPSRVAEDNPSDLAKYGLDTPVTLTLKDFKGWEGTLLIGGTDPGTGGRYVMFPNVPSVLIDETADYSFLTVAPYKMRSKLVFIHNIKDTAKVKASYDGITHVLDVNDTGDGFSASLDGGEISETNARRLFSLMHTFLIEGETPPDTTKGDFKLSITVTMRDGAQHTLILYTLNERQLTAWVNGEDTGYYVNIKDYNSLLEGFAKIEAGGEIQY